MRQALLISLIWHLLCICCVSVVFMPSGLQPKSELSVSFLGSILRGPFAPEQMNAPLNTDVKLLALEPELKVEKEHFSQRPNLFLQEEKKIINPDSLMGVNAFKEEKPVFSNLAAVEPAYKEREIIFRPQSPGYPEWLKQEFRARYVIFNICISAEGLVEQSICLQTSGNPEIDATLARYIERWRFAPAAENQGQWQTVKIDLDING